MRVRAGKSGAPGTKFTAYQQQFPELAAELTRRMNGALPEDFAAIAPRLRGETAG